MPMLGHFIVVAVIKQLIQDYRINRKGVKVVLVTHLLVLHSGVELGAQELNLPSHHEIYCKIAQQGSNIVFRNPHKITCFYKNLEAEVSLIEPTK